MSRKHSPEEAQAARLRRIERSRLWREANHERARESGRKYRQANRDAQAARVKAWAEANPDKVKAKTAAWVARNPEASKRKTAEWRKRNPDWDRAKQARRRAVGDLSARQIQDVVSMTDGVCSYCLRSCVKPTIDHVLPICRGGTNAMENLVGCCSTCNSSKRDKTPLEFVFGLPRLGGAA